MLEVNLLTEMIKQKHRPLVEYMLFDQDYPQLRNFLKEFYPQLSSKVAPWIDLAHNILLVDIEAVEDFAINHQLTYLIRPSKIQRKVYYFTHHLNLQMRKKEFADYFRGLTPVLVDIYRLAIEDDFMPDLNDYMMPTIKNTPDGRPLYRGLQWYEKKVEASNNKIKQTFNKYYGERFNYDHYVSSSHLIKLIDDHSTNQALKDKSQEMRLIEKYLRNIIAHEVICVNEAWIQQRMNMSSENVHQVYLDLVKLAGLDDSRQWKIFDIIHQKILDQLQLNDKEQNHEEVNH